MDQKSDLIKEDIDETRTHLTEKLVTLEDQLRDKVETAKETVEGTIDNVRTTLRKYSPSHNVQQHPFIAAGGAVAAGLIFGKLIANRRAASSAMWDRNYAAYGGTELGLPNIPQTSEFETHAPRHVVHAPAGPREPSQLATIVSKLTETFSEEISMVKGMAMGAAIDALRGYAANAYPDFKPQIDKVLDSAMDKVGAEHVGTHAQNETGRDQRSQPESRAV